MSKSFADSVMKQIEVQHVTMRPRWHFTALTTLGVIAVGLLAALNAYLIDLITIAVRVQGSSRPMYGARNRLADMIVGFPWWLVATAIVSFVLLIWFLRKNARLYKVRTIWLIAVALVVSVVFGLALSNASFNSGHQGPNHSMSRQNM